ncbi:hypothetical protein CROQUDRAFT_662723, partial [Cronartium quercuum f. sp. fusiforme G11]
NQSTSTTSTCSQYQNTNKRLIREDSSNPDYHHHRSPTSILNNPTPKQIKVGAHASIACETFDLSQMVNVYLLVESLDVVVNIRCVLFVHPDHLDMITMVSL